MTDVRDPVRELEALGPFPSDETATEDDLEHRDELLRQITRPVTDDESRVLVRLFPPGDCYGMGWTLLHLVETAPGWPLPDALENEDNEWVVLLKTRLENANRFRSS